MNNRYVKEDTRYRSSSLYGLIVLLTGCGVALLVLSIVVLVLILALRRRVVAAVVIVVVVVLLLIHFYHLGSIVSYIILNIHISVSRIIKNFSVLVKP